MFEFSVRLKQLRCAKHLTQAQVAQRIGVTPAMISAYESDLKVPGLDTMIRIANLFGVTVDYLLCREDKRFLDISDLNDDEATVICNMVEVLRRSKADMRK